MTVRIKVLGSSTGACVAVSVTLGLSLVPVGWARAGSPLGRGLALTLIQPSEADISLARIEYTKGEKAYRLGQFEEAARAFEKAYEKSGLPDILYNIGLSHLRWYDVDPDSAHLRKAKVVFQNYIIEIQKNPDLGDREEAETLIKQIDEKLADHDKLDPAGGPGSVVGPNPIDPGPDPGKKQRIGGAIAMGVGGALIVGGVVSGVVLGLRGQEFEENLSNAYDERDALACSTSDSRPACAEVNNRIETYRSNGRTANGLAVGLGVTLGGLGVIGIVTGAVLLIQGNKKTAAWEQRRVSVTPTWSPGGAGLGVSGRF